MERFIFLCLIVLCSDVVDATTMEFGKLLIEDLFKNYSKELRPVRNQSQPIHVNVDLEMISINDFDEVAGTISVVVILVISWKDESLVWNSTSYGNTTSLMLSQNTLWLPEMFLSNPADSFIPASNHHFKVDVTSDGDVTWNPGALLKSTCTPDVSKFPFDQHTCTIKVSPWGYPTTKVQLNIPSPTVSFRLFSLNTEWDVIGSETERWSNTYDMAYYHITIKRRHMNFIVSVVIPIIMLAFVNPFVFLLPFDSGERTSYSITVLLAFTVYMTVVSDRMPASSEPMSSISYYLLALVGISVGIVTVNIFQIRTYSKHEADEPVPEWMNEAYSHYQNIFRGKKVKAVKQNDKSARTDGNEKCNDDIFYASILPVTQIKEKVNIETVSMVTAHQQKEMTWNMVAKIIDKCYFVLFLFVIGIVTLTYFIQVN